MDDTVRALPAEYDPAKGTLSLSGKSPAEKGPAVLAARPDHLIVEGLLDKPLLVHLSRVDEASYRLAKSRVR
jgi:hypothetical protein